mgnify:CR=1 FL=1
MKQKKDKTIKKDKKKLIVVVANPKTDEEYSKMIDRVNEKFKTLYS